MDSKTSNEVLEYGVDWSTQLGTGDTISTSTWPTVEAGITKVSDDFEDTATTVVVSGGTSGNTYSLINRITTASGLTLEHIIGIPVQDLV
jgi:hypothetical protein